MKLNKQTYYLILFLLSALGFMACTQEPDVMNVNGDSSPLTVYVKIEGTYGSRAERMKIHDLWSYVDFQKGDEMGIFASGGNFNENNGPFDNEKLTYDGNKFNGKSESTFSPAFMKEDEIYLYFPYDPDITKEGMELRVEEDPENPTGPLRCIDLLTSSGLSIFGSNNGTDMALFGTMSHNFSELIIVRGEGFDAPPADTNETQYSRITAVLSEPITHAKITMTLDPWSCGLSFINDGKVSNMEARSWTAWKGGNFNITEHDEEGEEAWYVILPTVAGNRSYVDYIELYDNEGHLQRVSSLLLSGGKTKYIDPGWRYPMEITMKELVPTVNPFPILPWNDDVNLTDERKRGINNITEFATWVRDYNLYLLDSTNSDYISSLMKYGDQYIDSEGNVSWHFYVLSDLDFSKYEALPYTDTNGEEKIPQDVIIPRLQDILDGVSTTLVNSRFINHKILNLKTTFIGSMETNTSLQNNGTLQNFDFIRPDINKGENNTSQVGIISNNINGGMVSYCNIINGTLFNPGAPSGMITGSIYDGVVRNCTISGSLYSSTILTDSSYSMITGTVPTGTCTFENNDTADVIANRYN